MSALEPDRDQLEIFINAIFRHAQTGVVSLRAFVEGSNDVFRKTPIRIINNNLQFLCDAVEDDARRAAQHPKPVVFCPPLATFGNDKTAAEKDIAGGLTITVECDQHPDAARLKLEAILGPATTIVRSGGIWSDGNGDMQDKLHLHWRLASPARSPEDLVKLKRVREICARLVDADPTSIPISHPIRWPGSWHRKAQPRLTEIIACDPDVEIDLAAALAKLEPLAPAPAAKTSSTTAQPGGEWDTLTGNILAGKNLHTSIARLAMKMLRGGTPEIIAVQMLRGMMDAMPPAAKDERWEDRYADIPRAVGSAGRKLAAEAAQAQAQAPPPPPPPPPPVAPAGPAPAAAGGPGASPIEATLRVFKKWLVLSDATPIYAALGCIAANLLPGEPPVWLGIIAPPSSAKTEILNATAELDHVKQVATLTVAGLLSGVPKRSQARGTQGGLLMQIGDFGILVLKDFGSILSMHTETRAEVLGALREVYDGAWTRHVGTDGGRTLSWKGKIGLLFAATEAIDAHHAVIGSMGDRFLFSRLKPVRRGQFLLARKHSGEKTKRMREEISAAVAHLFATRERVPQDADDKEAGRIDDAIMLAVRLRGTVVRDARTRDIDAVYGAEGPARIGMALDRLFSGLISLKVNREIAMKVVERVALDSVPPLRRRIFEHLRRLHPAWADTPAVAKTVGLPTTTARRGLEELAAYALIESEPKPGQATLWRWNEDWLNTE